MVAGFAPGHEDPGTLSGLGIDVGPHTGFFAAWWDPGTWELLEARAFECSAAMAPDMLAMLLSRRLPRVAGIEAFVARGKAVKLAGVRTAEIMGQVAGLAGILRGYGVPVIARNAGTVKPWATDKRLEAAGLLKLAGSSPHIRDAGRHMLFSACQAGLPDPLSEIAKAGGSS